MSEVENIKEYEEKLQTRQLVDQIEFDMAVEETLKKKIVN